MILTKKLVYDFQRKYNQSSRGDRSQIPLVDIIAYLNEAQGIWYGQMADLYETAEFTASELRQFEVKNIELEFVKKDEYSSMFLLPKNMYKRLNQKAIVSDKTCCGDLTKIITIKIERSDKINEILKNPYFQPNFAWEQLPGSEAGELLHIYNGTMSIEKVLIDYLRFPQELHAPSLISGENCESNQYEDYAGVLITQDTNFEPTARFSDRKVVDIAVALAKGDRQDYNAFQKQLQAIIFGENALKTN